MTEWLKWTDLNCFWSYPNVLVVFPYFRQFKSEFCNTEFMIWATVSSQSCFSWLYRASPSLAAKNIINLILVLTIWWCPWIESSLVLLEEDHHYRFPKFHKYALIYYFGVSLPVLLYFVSGKKYNMAEYWHSAYLTYMQNISHKMLGWMKHKL